MPETAADRQAPRAAAAVLSTRLGPNLLPAARSIFAQDLGAPIQMLVAVVARGGEAGLVDRLRAECPAHVLLTVADPGLPPPEAPDSLYGAPGMTAAALAFLANSPFLAFLDEAQRWMPDHLAALRRAIEGRSWAATRRVAVAPAGAERIEDVDDAPADARPAMLMVDKQRHAEALVRWARPTAMPTGLDMLGALRRGGHGGTTGRATLRGPAAAAPPPRPPSAPSPRRRRDLLSTLADWRVGPGAGGTALPLAPAAIPGIGRIVATLRPAAAIVLGGDADAIALAVALVARRLSLRTIVAAIDPFLGAPDDLADAGRRRALPRRDGYPLLLDRLRQAVRGQGLADRLIPVAADPLPMLATLAAEGVAVALAFAELGGEGAEFLIDLDALWPLVETGGAVVGRIAWPDRIGREMLLRRWAARAGAAISIAPDEGGGGGATVALRRR